MNNWKSKIIGLLSLGILLYNTLLIGGGRGPFALYEDHWSCHCNDLYATVDEKPDPYADLGIELEVLAGSIREPLIPQNSEELCLSPELTKSSGAEGQNDVCKRKLPLRYMSLLLANAVILAFQSNEIVLNPEPLYWHELHSYALTLLQGNPFDPIKPPPHMYS